MKIERLIIEFKSGDDGDNVLMMITRKAAERLARNSYTVVTTVQQKLEVVYETISLGYIPCYLGVDGKIYAVYSDKTAKQLSQLTAC